MYTANKYITNNPSDYSNTRIPSLSTITANSAATIAHENWEKADTLAQIFLPPPPATPVIPPTTHPAPIQAHSTFSHKMIHDAIQTLKPYKVPRVDSLQNIVLQKCVKNITDYIYFIFWAILDFEEYPPCWLIILTIVLHKPGKATYNVAKAYRPIGLLEMLGKLFSTLVAMISHI